MYQNKSSDGIKNKDVHFTSSPEPVLWISTCHVIHVSELRMCSFCHLSKMNTISIRLLQDISLKAIAMLSFLLLSHSFRTWYWANKLRTYTLLKKNSSGSLAESVKLGILNPAPHKVDKTDYYNSRI